MNAKEIRQEARQNLKGKWQKAIIISIIYAAIVLVLSLLIEYANAILSSIFSIFSPIFSIVQLVIAPALTYGIAYSYWHLKKGDEVGYVDFITVGFKNFGRAWGIVWEIIKKTWWCILLFIIPLMVIIALGSAIIFANSGLISTKSYNSAYTYGGSTRSTYQYNTSDSLNKYRSSYPSGYTSSDLTAEDIEKSLSGISVGAVVGILVAFIAYIVLAIFVSIRFLLYVLSYYIAVIKEDASPKDAVVESANLMKGNRWRYFCLTLSFFGWFLLVGLVTGVVQSVNIPIISTIITEIGTAILNPYIAFAAIIFYENLSKERNLNGQNQNNIAANNTQNV